MAQEGHIAQALSLLNSAVKLSEPIPVEHGKALCKKGLVYLLQGDLRQATQELYHAKLLSFKLDLLPQSELMMLLHTLETKIHFAQNET